MDVFIFMLLKACNSQPIMKAMFFPFWTSVFQGRIFQKYHVTENTLYLKDISVIGAGFLLQWRALWGFMVETTLCWSGMGWFPERLTRKYPLTSTTPFKPVGWMLHLIPCGKRQSCIPSFLPMWARENWTQAKGWRMEQRQKTSFSFSPSCQVIC